jgi:RNA polymerase sigma-70 factor (ECF subfamily)
MTPPTAPPLRDLLDKLCAGDAAAAEQVFRAYEPYLRLVVRRQLSARLRSKFDSIDVVQSIWADVLRGFREADWRFTDEAQLKAFLIKATRNRFLDRLRQHQTALRREHPLVEGDSDGMPAARQPQPSEEAQAAELWQQMLTLCPPAHREILRLKRQGVALAEIATRTGLHESSVRRIIYDLARRLRKQQEQAVAL